MATTKIIVDMKVFCKLSDVCLSVEVFGVCIAFTRSILKGIHADAVQ